MTQAIQVDNKGPVGILEFARPEKFNCLSMNTFGQIAEALTRFESDPAISVLLLCAAGKNFCTGAELDEVDQVRTDEAALRQFLEIGHQTLNRFEDSRLPIVVAVQGLCLAGGLECVMACDVVFAADTARFGDQHAQFGLVPGWGGSQRLPRLIGQRRAIDLMFSARWISATQAENWGLVNHVVPAAELREQALLNCQTLASRNSKGVELMKRLANAGSRAALREGLRTEIELAMPMLMSAQVQEGLNAFKERRQPDFGRVGNS